MPASSPAASSLAGSSPTESYQPAASLATTSANPPASQSPPPPAAPDPLPPGVAAPPTEVDAAPVALLVDLSSGRTLYARDPDRPFLPASVTKTMTAFVAFDLLSRGKLRPQQIFNESDDAWAHWHNTGSRMFLNRGQPVSVDQLLTGIMTVSANDGCIVLAEGASGSVANWVAMMNAEARSLGMTGSHFGTPNGWMDNGNTYFTAHDLVKLADAMISRYPGYYHRYVGRPAMTWNGITQPNHDPILNVPGADGIKTGWTDEAHYTFLGSAMRGGRRLVMVLAGVPTGGERARAARALIEWGFAAWDSHPLFAAGARVGVAAVQGGTVPEVPLLVPRAYAVTTPKGGNLPVSAKILYQGPLMAPIAKGEEIGTLEVKVGNDAPYRLPLVAGAGVGRGGLVDRLLGGLKGLIG